MDVFCQIKNKYSDQIIEETQNFYVLHDAFPLAEGHLLIIPKAHRVCFLEIREADQKEELNALIKKASGFLSHNYTAPRIFEHGGMAQTVPHAHLHLLPTRISILENISHDLVVMEKPAIPYLYYKENDIEHYFRSEKDIAPGYLHASFAKKLKRPLVAMERETDGKKWLVIVKNKWSIWQKD
jgi:diadenosine tetraphosphate (Ap4A) HIT family hydrolase